MALTEKQKENIREEEALRLEVRTSQSHGSKCTGSSKRRKAFWMGVAAGIIGSLLFGQLVCKRGYASKSCKMGHAGSTSEAPVASGTKQ